MPGSSAARGYHGGVRANLVLVALSGALVTSSLALAVSCKKSTSVRATYVANFGCKTDGSLAQPVFFAIARVGEPLVFDGRAPRPEHAETCIPAEAAGDATVGDLAVTPNPDYAGAYDLVAVVGSEKEPTAEACGLDADFRPKVGADGKALLGGAHCVVARRRVRFVEGQEVAQRILLSRACAGVLCAEGTTCNPETRMCTTLQENSSHQSGGKGTGEGEVEGGVAALDAGAPSDAPVVPPPPPACEGPAGPVSVLPLTQPGVATSLAAADGRTTFINADGKPVLVSFPASGPVPTLLPDVSGKGFSAQHAGFSNIGGATRLVVTSRAFGTPGASAVYWDDQSATWGNLAGYPQGNLAPVPAHMASNGAVFGGVLSSGTPLVLRNLKAGPGFVLFGNAGSFDAAIRPIATATKAQGTAIFVVRGRSILGLPAEEEQEPFEHGTTLPQNLNVSALVALEGPGEVFVISGGKLIFLGPGFSGQGGAPNELATNVVATAADPTYVYAAVDRGPSGGAVLAIDRTTRAVCSVTIPGSVKGLAADGTRIYALTEGPNALVARPAPTGTNRK